MNCIEVERLLPLYVEGDVNEREAHALRAHLSSCKGCSELAEEFRASQERLHNFAVPDFGAEFYEGIRREVLTKINSRTGARTSLLFRLRPQFALRPALAASFALLFLFAAGVILLYRSQQRSATALAALEKSMGDFHLDEIKEAGTTPARITTPAASRNVIERSARRKLASKEIEAPAPESVAKVNATRQQAIARMEIQTSDPNIRIIWLARKTAE